MKSSNLEHACQVNASQSSLVGAQIDWEDRDRKDIPHISDLYQKHGRKSFRASLLEVHRMPSALGVSGGSLKLQQLYTIPEHIVSPRNAYSIALYHL